MRLPKVSIRYGKAFRMRGMGYETMVVGRQTEDERRFHEILNAMPAEDAAVIGRIVDPEWYAQNASDVSALEAWCADHSAAPQ